MDNPTIIDITENEKSEIPNIKQEVVKTTDRWKGDALAKILEEDNPFMAIIFCRTKRRADELEIKLSAKGIRTSKLHSDVPQNKREQIMKSFRNCDIQYLIATDVASRGIDVTGVTHIYNYDAPESVEKRLVNDEEVFAGVESIGAMAFYGCNNLSSVFVPETVTEIGNYAIGYYCDEEKDIPYAKNESVMIYGTKGSAAEAYAFENEILFVDVKDFSSYFSYELVDDENALAGVFSCLRDGDPDYDDIKNGAWLNDEPYIAIHRIASAGTHKGIFTHILNYCLSFSSNIKIDTYIDNTVMQSILAKHGFKKCGTITAAGLDFIAFQLFRE
jgi:hypothetical protein